MTATHELPDYNQITASRNENGQFDDLDPPRIKPVNRRKKTHDHGLSPHPNWLCSVISLFHKRPDPPPSTPSTSETIQGRKKRSRISTFYYDDLLHLPTHCCILFYERDDDIHRSQPGSSVHHRDLHCTCTGSCSAYYYRGRCIRPRLNGPNL